MTNPFYFSRKWRRRRRDVLELDHYECQYCKARGKHTQATHVHHVWHLDKYPQYGLDMYVNGKRNLMSCCKDCHETVGHPERLRRAKEQLNEERW